MQFIIYTAIGQIVRTGSCSADVFAAQASNPGEIVMEGTADDSKQYVDLASGAVLPKRAMTATLTDQTISGLPPQTVVTVNGEDTFELPEGDTDFELGTTTSGTYDVHCVAPTYVPKTFIIEVA